MFYLRPYFITSALMSGLQLITTCVYKNFSCRGRALQQAINQKCILDTVNLIAYLESKLNSLPD